MSEGIQISLVASVGVLTANATDSTSITTQVVSGTLTSTSGNVRISSLHDYDQATNKLLSSHETLASIESVSASLLVQVSTANVSSDARTTTIATTDGSSRLSAVGGTVTVEARSANLSLARAKSSGGALVSVSADINPHATSEGVTRANLLGDVSEGAGPGAVTIGVVSDGFDLSTAVLDTSTGGLVDIQANTGSHATTNSTVSAQLGDDAGGSVVNASNDITLRAGSITDADATTRSASGGGINVHVYSANADTTPHIDVKVGAGTSVTAPTVTVDAEHDTTPPTYSDGTFDAGTQVDGSDGFSGNKITFTADHGLGTGQIVTYVANASSVGGLVDGRKYVVIVPAGSTKSLQLGAVFDGATIDPLTDEITFKGAHNLQTGDSVYYFPASDDPTNAVPGLTAGKRYIVEVIDPATGLIAAAGAAPSSRVIKLRDPAMNFPAAVTVNGGSVSVNGSGQGVVTATNSFQNGDPVTYIAPPAGPPPSFGSAVVNLVTDGNDGKPKVVCAPGKTCTGTNPDPPTQLVYDTSNTLWLGSGTPDSNGVFPNGHNFSDGEAVIYHATGGNGVTIGPAIHDGETLFVHRLNAYQIQLADSFCHAVGCADPDGNGPLTATPQQFLTLTGDLSDLGRQVVHSLVAANDAPLTGLVPGQVYFVVNRHSGDFQLAATPGGSPIFFSNGGHSGGPHTFQVQGVNLTAAAQCATQAPFPPCLQNLVLDISPGSGTGTLDGVGGSAALAGAPTGDETATASSSGSSGGVINVNGASADASVHPIMTNTIGSNAVIHADHISVTTMNVGRVAGYAENGGGGLVAIGDSNTSATSNVETTLTIATGAQLIATFDVTVNAGAAIVSTVRASGGAGGLGAGIHANANSSLTHTTKTIVQGTITGGTDVLVEASTTINGFANASSQGGGLGVDADATATAIVQPSSVTQTEIWGTARVTGNRVQIAALVPSASLQTHADSEADAFGADSDATAKSLLRGESLVLLKPISGDGQQLVGNTAVWLRSEYQDIRLRASTDADCSCFAGDTNSDSYLDAQAVAKVSGENESFIKTSDLTVDANQYVNQFDRPEHAHGGAFVGHGECDSSCENKDARRQIYWETTVIMLGEPNPELTVDASGTITKLVNVTVTDENGVSYGLGQTIQGNRIEVGDIQYDSSGVARFRANSAPLSGATDSEIWGNAGLFDYQETWDYVRIFNYSPKTLVTHLIDVVNGGQNALVTIAVDHIPFTSGLADNVSLPEFANSGSTIEWDIVHTFVRPIVEIHNFQPGAIASSNIVLAGQLGSADTIDSTIENPIGTTIVTNERGSVIVSSTVESSHPEPAFLLLRTNILTLNADGGSVGEHTSVNGVVTVRRPIPVELVQFEDGPALTRENPPQLRPITITVEAGTDAVVDLRAVLRETTSADDPFQVTIQSFHAGRDADVHLLDSVEELQPGTLGPQKVLLFHASSSYPTTPRYRTPPGNPYENDCSQTDFSVISCGLTPYSGFYARHFHPSTGGDYTELGAFGGTRTTIDSDYFFPDLKAGRDIAVYHVPTTLPETFGSTITLTLSTDVDAALSGVGISSTPDNVGKIDLFTNGFVYDVELNGDLRAGQIVSTVNDVTLVAPRSVIDGEDGTGTLGSDPTPTDVEGVNITITAGSGCHAVGLPYGCNLGNRTGGVGLPGDFLEIAVDRNGANHGLTNGEGVLTVTDIEVPASPTGAQCLFFGICGTHGVFVDQTRGDLRLNVVDTHGDASLTTDPGDIVDARAGSGTALDTPNVFANSVDLWAEGGTIGQAVSPLTTLGNDVEIDSQHYLPGDVGLRADVGIFVTETASKLDLVLAEALTGDIRLTVRESTAQGEDLNLLHDGSVLFVENAAETVPHGRVQAWLGNVRLQVGDNVTTAADTFLLAGQAIDVHGDYSVVAGGPSFYETGGSEPTFGTVMFLQGTIGADQLNASSTPLYDARIFGNLDADTITFEQTTLTSRVRVYGSIAPTGATPPTPDGEDHLIVDRLETMAVARNQTLTLDGQAGSDVYEIFTTGSRGASRDYVINVLDSGAPGDGADVLAIYGYDDQDPAHNGVDPTTQDNYPVDDIFLLRRVSSIACAGPDCTNESAALRPAFVGVLHTDVAGATGTKDPGTGIIGTGSFGVERINYSATDNGRLEVYGLGGNDLFAVDDNSARRRSTAARATTRSRSARSTACSAPPSTSTARTTHSRPSRPRAATSARARAPRSSRWAATATTPSPCTRTRPSFGSRATTATTPSSSAASRSPQTDPGTGAILHGRERRRDPEDDRRLLDRRADADPRRRGLRPGLVQHQRAGLGRRRQRLRQGRRARDGVRRPHRHHRQGDLRRRPQRPLHDRRGGRGRRPRGRRPVLRRVDRVRRRLPRDRRTRQRHDQRRERGHRRHPDPRARGRERRDQPPRAVDGRPGLRRPSRAGDRLQRRHPRERRRRDHRGHGDRPGHAGRAHARARGRPRRQRHARPRRPLPRAPRGGADGDRLRDGLGGLLAARRGERHLPRDPAGGRAGAGRRRHDPARDRLDGPRRGGLLPDDPAERRRDLGAEPDARAGVRREQLESGPDGLGDGRRRPARRGPARRHDQPQRHLHRPELRQHRRPQRRGDGARQRPARARDHAARRQRQPGHLDGRDRGHAP